MVDGIGYDVLVLDGELEAAGDEAVTRGDRLEERLERYIACLGRITSDAIAEGDTAENLRAFSEAASALKGEIAEFSKGLKTNTNKFIENMDEADNRLY